MKRLLFFIAFSLCAIFAQAQFRLAVNGTPSWSNLGGGLYQATVTFHADLTGNSYAVAGIVDTMRLFTSRGQVFEIDSVWGKTFSQATLRVEYLEGTISAPVGQGMVYDPNNSVFVPDVPFGSTGATAQLNQSVVSYNATKSGRLIDGDYTDIDVTSSGTVMTIDTGAVTWLKLAQAVKDSIGAGGGGAGTYTDTMYVLAFGQSNMLGWQGGGDTLSDSRVQVWNDTIWKTAYLGQHPFRVSIGVRWNNLAFHFCRKLAEDRDVIVRLILNAEANRPIEDWVPSTATKYVQIEAAIAAAGVPRIDAILMHQGEANGDLSGSWCNNDTCYQAKLDSLIDQFRAESWVSESTPFIAGAVIDLKNPGRNNVLSALGDDGKQNTMFIPNTDIAFDTDSVHYTGAGLEAFGKRYYSYYRERNNSINLASTEVYGVLPIESGGTGLSSVGSEYSALKTVGGVATWGGVVNGNTTAGYIPRMTDDAGKYLRNSPFQTNGETTALGASPSSFSRFRIGANQSLSLAGLNGATVYIPAQTTTDTSTASGATENYQTAFSILRPTFAASKGPVTYSIGSTFYINNSPAAGTNVTINTPWAIWVDAGNVRLDGSLHVGQSPFTTTSPGVINASAGYRLSDAATSGNYLRGNGTNFVSSAIQAGDISSIAALLGGNTGPITLGTNNATPFHFEVANSRVMSIPSSGITSSTTASKMLTLDSNDSLKYNTVISSEWDNTVTQSGSDTLLNSASGYGHFQRVGNIVTFTLRIEIALTNTGNANTVYIDPPVASNFTTAASDVIGTATMDPQTLSGANTQRQRCLVFASDSDDKIGVSFDPVASLTYPENRMYISVSGSYIIQ